MFHNLDAPPRPIDAVYLQADFVELSCLLQLEKSLERGEVANLYAADADTNELNDFDVLENDAAANSDFQLSRVNQYWEHIRYRSHTFADTYPFSCSRESGELRLRDDINDYQKLYIYLLLSSSLRNLKPQLCSRITDDFEKLCAQALRQYLGDASEVRRFGKGKSSDYTGSKYDKISNLAQDIFESVIVDTNSFYSRDTGDGGLDLVAWFPVPEPDHSPNRLLVFAQCACGNRWMDKQHSSGYDKWSRLISLSTKPVNAMFIPYCFRGANGAWYQPYDIQMTVLIDRFRLMQFLRLESSPLQELSPETLDIIETAIKYRYG